MRIVIDDTNLPKAVESVKEFVRSLDIKSVVHYEYGMDRVNSTAFRSLLNSFLNGKRFEIGNTVTHAHGIGNNCQYPVFFRKSSNEMEQVGFININSGMFGEAYCYMSDYNQKSSGPVYEITKRGTKIK